MSEHPNVARLRDGYTAFSKGDLAALDELFAEDIRWYEGGSNQLSGAYEGRAAVYELFGRLSELTEGSFRLDLRTVFADDTDGVAVAEASAHRGTKSFEHVLDVHVHRFGTDGRIVEFRHATTDVYTIDEVFG